MDDEDDDGGGDEGGAGGGALKSAAREVMVKAKKQTTTTARTARGLEQQQTFKLKMWMRMRKIRRILRSAKPIEIIIITIEQSYRISKRRTAGLFSRTFCGAPNTVGCRRKTCNQRRPKEQWMLQHINWCFYF